MRRAERRECARRADPKVARMCSARSRAVRAAENDARLVVERRDVVLTQRAAACGSRGSMLSPEFRGRGARVLQAASAISNNYCTFFAKPTALRRLPARDL